MMTTPTILGQHYAFATGRTGVLTAQLLRSADIDRLLGAPSGEEAVRMMGDIEFLKVEDNDSFQQTLDRSSRVIMMEAENMVPEEKHCLLHGIWIDGDRAQMSYALKEKHNFVSQIAEQPKPPVSVFDNESWQERFPDLAEMEFDSPEEIDDAVAKACYAFKKRCADRSGSTLIREYTNTLIEAHEEQARLRADSDTETDFLALEIKNSEELGDLLDQMEKITLGPEAPFAYAARAFSHIALLKILLTGKVNNLPIQEIKSLLPPLI